MVQETLRNELLVYVRPEQRQRDDTDCVLENGKGDGLKKEDAPSPVRL